MIHSFLLIGQSNMAGRGFIDEAQDIDASRIKTLRNGRWHTMFRPINPDRSFSGVNLAESFAEAYVKEYGVDVGLICCADGGTSLDQWKQGGLLFDHAVAQAKLAQRTSVLSGILWHQGETDCHEDLYPTYQKRMQALIEAFYKELDAEGVPFVVGGLGDYLPQCALHEKLKNYGFINHALQALAQENETVGFASAEGLTANPDQLHFNAKSLYTFGLRYFDAFVKINGKRASIKTPLEEDGDRSFMELL